MKRTYRFALVTFALTFFTAWTTLCQEKAASAQDQSPRLEQIEHVGRKFHLDAMSDTNVLTTTTVAGRLFRTTTDRMKYELSADVITLATSPDNWVTRERFTVLWSKMTIGEKSAPILPEGTVVDLSILEGKNIYQVNNKQVEDQIASVLEDLISLHTAPISDGEMLGTDQQRKVGETWTVNADAIRRELDRRGAEGGVISGRGAFERGTNDRLILKSSFVVKDVLMPISPEFNKEKGEMRAEYSRETPTAQSEQSSIETHSLHVVRVGIPKRNKDVIFSIVLDETAKSETRPVMSGRKDVAP